MENSFFVQCVYRANQLTLPFEIKTCASLQLFKYKIKLSVKIDVNVRFAQDILAMLVIFNWCFCYPSLHKAKLYRCRNCTIIIIIIIIIIIKIGPIHVNM